MHSFLSPRRLPFFLSDPSAPPPPCGPHRRGTPPPPPLNSSRPLPRATPPPPRPCLATACRSYWRGGEVGCGGRCRRRRGGARGPACSGFTCGHLRLELGLDGRDTGHLGVDEGLLGLVEMAAQIQRSGTAIIFPTTPARGVGEAMASATGSGSGQQQSSSTAPADADPGAAADKLVFEAAPQPMRDDYVENAVKFLSHPKVRGSPIVYRRSFLEKKASPPRRSTRPSKESLF